MNALILLTFLPLFFCNLYAYTEPEVETFKEPYKHANIIEELPTPINNFLSKIELTHLESGIKNIDCIYVINLDFRPNRWIRTLRNFNLHGCYPNRVSAVNGWEIPLWMKEQLSGPFPVKLNGGMIGCLLSHVSIYKDAYERGFNTVWICEDDIKFTDDVKKLSGFVDELNSIDPDWDILYTDYTQHGTGMQAHRPGQSPYRVLSQIVNQSKTLVRMHGRHQTHSMIFSKKGIKKVLDYFTHIHLWTPIDIDIHYVPNIREYSVRKDIATFINDSPYSDTEHKNN